MALGDPITLRKKRGVKIDKPRLIDFGGAIVPPLGGETQTIHRLGSRHAIDITIPTMPTEPEGRQWAADLSLAKLYGAIVAIRQDGLRIGIPGSPVVDGGGQLGSLLALRGFTPGYVMRYGQWLNITVSGILFLYRAAETTVAGNDGRMVLPLFPMLRRSPDDGSEVGVSDPKLQGSLSGNEVSWTRLTAPYTDFGTISISEDR